MRILVAMLSLVFLSGCEKDWQHYYSMTGEFSIDTPESPREAVKFADMAIGPVTVNSVVYSGGTREEPFVYVVNFYELSEMALKLEPDVILALASKSFLEFSGRTANVISKKEVTASGVKGLELDLSFGGGKKAVRGRVFYANEIVYYVVVEKVGDVNMNEEDNRFLDSFTFHFKDK